ncbi:MAG: site-specific DNA-methyltransferase [bacterium]|jgi:DNA modification methylase|nr:site-specific DNA-methyltransferase [bacterium]
MKYRIPDSTQWPCDWINQIHQGDALHTLRQLPGECVALAVTSPPYWNVIDYGIDRQIGHSSYEEYLQDLLQVWKETFRVLIPNGKLAIVTPIMPIPKKVINNQHTRHLKNICNDIERTILDAIDGFHRYSLFVWQKQTTKKMFGSYPHPPNIYEDNTIEFINVLVKDGKPPQVSKTVKEANHLTQQQWCNLSMQVWPMMPADIQRSGGHPCPFPVSLPQRLMMMYTFKRVPEDDFGGDLVLDMFNGTGATCLAAEVLQRNYLGIDLNAEYCERARQRLGEPLPDAEAIFLPSVRVKQARTSLVFE